MRPNRRGQQSSYCSLFAPVSFACLCLSDYFTSLAVPTAALSRSLATLQLMSSVDRFDYIPYYDLSPEQYVSYDARYITCRHTLTTSGGAAHGPSWAKAALEPSGKASISAWR